MDLRTNSSFDSRGDKPISMELTLLGFGLRRPFAEQHSNWPEERRSQFLIRPEVPIPISVDCGVWPVFVANPDKTYPLHLWGSVSEILTTFPDTERNLIESPVIIEIAVAATDKPSSAYWEQMFFGRVEVEKDRNLDITRDCLGYDVADHYFVSGLSNCMLPGDELTVIRTDWSEAINSWGMFRDLKSAIAFRAVCNDLVPEHAPFETFRIRKVTITKAVFLGSA